MNKKLKIAIYCRVLSDQAKDLLVEQERILVDFANDNNMEIETVIKEVAEGDGFTSKGFRELIGLVVNHEIDAVVFYDKTTICIYDHLYVEFELICQKHQIFLIPFRPLVLGRLF